MKEWHKDGVGFLGLNSSMKANLMKKKDAMKVQLSGEKGGSSGSKAEKQEPSLGGNSNLLYP